MNGSSQNKPLTPNAALAKMLASWLAGTILTAALIFIAAGRLDWPLAWLFVLAWSLFKVVFITLLRWRNPGLIVERATHHENTQPYDRWILPAYFVLAFGAIVVAGLDGGRFRWSGDMPVILIIVSYIIYLLGNFLAAWAVDANAFFSSESRLQTDRQQTVTRSGPYRFVRHPGYLAAVILWPATGPMLESWWAVLPGLLAALMMFIRTVYEDRMLQAELPGYKDYAQQVRYRLFPGIW
ncbi:MAG TPA: isoprenylcysteine carboxylmethyltransferase family protein [Anaerolineales bacterium]|nr:isoprenylcysteine carboxylmethyltransferase family protein [Anaerolineales bacterium]